MERSCVVIINPTAGGGRAGRAWPRLGRRLAESGCEHIAFHTTRPGEATELCRIALRDGAKMILAAGGDGTLNEVVNGFFDRDGQSKAVEAGACLGVLPLGTGSDFARSIKIGGGKAAIEVIGAGATAMVDVGRVEFHAPDNPHACRYFLNVADLGLGGEAALRVRRIPRRLGPLLTYLVGAIQAVVAHQPYDVTIELDEEGPVRAKMGLVVVANSGIFGGGMPVCPGAELDDGQLDVLRLAGMSRGRLLFDLLPKLYRAVHLAHPAVSAGRARRIRVASEQRMALEIDGEPVGEAPAEFLVMPKAMRIIVPQSWLDQPAAEHTPRQGGSA